MALGVEETLNLSGSKKEIEQGVLTCRSSSSMTCRMEVGVVTGKKFVKISLVSLSF